MTPGRSIRGRASTIAATFAAILKISGKTTQTLFNGLSLLKLSPEIQAVIQEENLPVSQGYLFAANLGCSDLIKAVNSRQRIVDSI